MILFFALIFAPLLQAQETRKSLQECIELAMQHNLRLQSAALSVEEAQALQGTAFNPDKTGVAYEQDPLTKDWIDKKLSITQSFEFPTVYTAQGRMLKAETRLAEQSQALVASEITRDVSAAYFNLCHALQRLQLFLQQDSVYAGFIEKAAARVKSGESNRLELMNAQSRQQENRLQLSMATTEAMKCRQALQVLVNTDVEIAPVVEDAVGAYHIRPNDDVISDSLAHPLLSYYEQQSTVNAARLTVERNKLLPDIFGAYSFNDTHLPGFQIGLSVPLFFGSNRARIKAAKIRGEQINVERQQAEQSLKNAYSAQLGEFRNAVENLDYYQTTGVAQANEILKTVQTAYHLGEIGYLEYIQNLQTAIEVKLQYVDALNRYNQSLVILNYLKGNQK